MGIVVEGDGHCPFYSSTTTKRWLLLIDVAASAAPNNPSRQLRKCVSTHSPCERGRYPPNHYFQFSGIVEHPFFPYGSTITKRSLAKNVCTAMVPETPSGLLVPL